MKADSASALRQAIETLDQPAHAVLYHYVRAAVQRYGSVSETARRLGMHRRTLQRMLDKQGPKRRANVALPKQPLP